MDDRESLEERWVITIMLFWGACILSTHGSCLFPEMLRFKGKNWFNHQCKMVNGSFYTHSTLSLTQVTQRQGHFVGQGHVDMKRTATWEFWDRLTPLRKINPLHPSLLRNGRMCVSVVDSLVGPPHDVVSQDQKSSIWGHVMTRETSPWQQSRLLQLDMSYVWESSKIRRVIQQLKIQRVQQRPVSFFQGLVSQHYLFKVKLKLKDLVARTWSSVCVLPRQWNTVGCWWEALLAVASRHLFLGKHLWLALSGSDSAAGRSKPNRREKS